MKYVIVDRGFVELPVVFSECQNHSDFLEMGEITGAGFVTISKNKSSGEFVAKVYGKSSSLKMEAKEEDEYILNQMLNKY